MKIDTEQVLAEIREATLLIGRCDHCEYHEVDGEHGQIRSCCHPLLEELEDLPYEVFEYLMSDLNRCPFWKRISTMSTGFCKEHNWFYVLSIIGCNHCWDEFEKEQRKIEGENKDE